MLHIEITNKNQNIIFSNILPNHKEAFKNKKTSKVNGIRSIFKKDRDGFGLWIITDDIDIYKSGKMANKTFNFLSDMFLGISKHYEIITLSNTHTIATIQAKMSQQIEALVGTNKNQRGNYQKVIEEVKNKIVNNTQEVSRVICDLNKRIEEIGAHLNSLQILENRTAVDLKNHPLKNMLLNIYAPFQENFKNKKIKVIFDRIDMDSKITVDYKIFSLVMHHFFDNALKYSRPDDEINFIFSSDNLLVINMHSIKIEKQDNIFEVGVSGRNADSLAGDGIGMHVIKKGLEIMHMNIEIKDNGKLEKNQKFNKNCFVVKCVS